MAGLKTRTPDDPDLSRQKPDFALPAGYASEDDFLSEMRTTFADDLGYDLANREAASEDLAFVTGNQWPEDVLRRRNAARKPILTINRLQAFVAQVLGSRRLNETQIRFTPDNGGTKKVAQVREDLVRSIQKESRAGAAYDNALLGAVTCGIGNFEVTLDYANDDVFEQKIVIRPILDHLAVIWDRRLADPTGRDAKRCWTVDTMTMADFKREYPWAMPSDVMADATLHSQVYGGGWIVNSDVRVVSYWRMRSERRVLALMTDGSTQDITDATDPEEIASIAIRPDGSLFVREVDRPYAQKYICSGTDILEGPYNLPLSRVPVFRVPGWEIQIGPQKFRYGMIRFLKDPQRLHNYLRSVVAEKLMQAPRAVWLAAANAVAGREKEFRDSHVSDDPLLIWNEEAGNKPERIAPSPMEVSLLQQAEMTNQDIKDVSNIHEANLGMPSNEVSGVAIQARQRVSDTGTILYHDNLDSATEECGRVIDQLIPVVYDTPRIVKTLGSNAEDNMQVINVLGNPASIDITEGKYSVTVTTGPTYATKRIEQAESMLKLANAMPNVLGVAADLIVEAQDWPGADKIAARLRATLPPGILAADEMSPEAQAAAAQKQQEQQTGLSLEMAKAVADYMSKQSQAQLNTARAQHYQVQTALAPGAAQNQSMSTASEIAAREAQAHIEVLKIGT